MLAIPSAFRKFNSGGRLVLASKATAAALYASSPYPANSALFTNLGGIFIVTLINKRIEIVYVLLSDRINCRRRRATGEEGQLLY
jgi:hypothetical protein